MQRPFNSIARSGAAKNTVDAIPTKPGMVRRTIGDQPLSVHHGVTVADEPLTTKTFTGKIPVHSAMTPKQRAEVHPVANDPKVILTEASSLGNPEKRRT